MNDLKEAVKEASISIACALDDVGEPYCNEECEKDLQHIQDKITEIESLITESKPITFDEWLGKCPVPYNTSCSNDGLTELYDFDTSKCEEE